ncbi:MAG: hypothetical protein [Olavius algarvensis Delta 4 endosymbiont]|nr:MAG: hypothetical protein [Olavius algarvensis Delta 4 endosymbiont]
MTIAAKTATSCALKIHASFTEYQARFQQVTRRASGRFGHRQWSQMQSDALERLDLYPNCLDTVARALEVLLGDHREDKQLWGEIKTIYA